MLQNLQGVDFKSSLWYFFLKLTIHWQVNVFWTFRNSPSRFLVIQPHCSLLYSTCHCTHDLTTQSHICQCKKGNRYHFISGTEHIEGSSTRIQGNFTAYVTLINGKGSFSCLSPFLCIMTSNSPLIWFPAIRHQRHKCKCRGQMMLSIGPPLNHNLSTTAAWLYTSLLHNPVLCLFMVPNPAAGLVLSWI